MSPNAVVTIEIAGQRYPIRSSLEPAYVAELASYVEQKMRLAVEAAPASDMMSLAILVALNLADEYFRARDQVPPAQSDFNERALRLERMLDRALTQVAG